MFPLSLGNVQKLALLTCDAQFQIICEHLLVEIRVCDPSMESMAPCITCSGRLQLTRFHIVDTLNLCLNPLALSISIHFYLIRISILFNPTSCFQFCLVSNIWLHVAVNCSITHFFPLLSHPFVALWHRHKVKISIKECWGQPEAQVLYK